MSPLPRRTAAMGFTLLEMLVVMTILAALGGAAIYATGDLREQSLKQLSLMEMQKIKQALLQYRQDVGNLPVPAHPADFAPLYVQGSQEAWDVVTARGWRGPYLSRHGEGQVDVGDGLASNGSGSPVAVAAAPLMAIGVADPFAAAPAAANGYGHCDETSDNSPGPTGHCLLDWRTAAGQPTHTRWGRPYLLFDLTDGAKARIVGMGPDGRYAGVAADPCVAVGDDLVLCLQH